MNITNNYSKQQASRIKVEVAALIVGSIIVLGTISHIFAYVAFVLSVLALFFLTEEDRLSFVAFLMPFASIFKSAPGAQSFFTYLLIVYVIYSLLQKRRIEPLFLVSFLLLGAVTVLQMYISINILKTIKFLVFVLFIYVGIGVHTTTDHSRVFLFYILGIIVSSAVASLGIIPNLADYIKEAALTENEEVRFSGLYPDPNYYTVNVIMALCLVVVMNHKKQLGTSMSLALAVPLVAFAIMTYSKSAFLMLLLPIALLLYSRIKRRNHLMFLVLMLAAILVVFSVFAGKIEIFESVLDRFGEDGDLDELTTKRYSIWLDYIDYLSDVNIHTFMGAGIGAEFLNKRAAHNTYIDLMYYLGFIGSVLLIAAIANAAKQKQTAVKRNWLNYGGWFCVIPTYFFLSELFFYDWPFHILLALLIFKTNMYPQETRKQ